MNYKPTKVDHLSVGGLTLPFTSKQSNSTLIMLRSKNAAVIETLDDFRTDAAYQVPSGKVAYIIAINAATNMNNLTDKVEYSDDEDASTNPVILIHRITGTGDFMSQAIPAGKYINKNSSLTADSVTITIVERDA